MLAVLLSRAELVQHTDDVIRATDAHIVRDALASLHAPIACLTEDDNLARLATRFEVLT